MGKLPPMIYASGLKKRSQVRFYGYEKLGTEGAIRDMQNMTSDFWPQLAVREKRVTVRKVDTPGGMAAWDELIWADGTTFHYGDKSVEGFLLNGRSDGEEFHAISEHKFAVLGDYVTIWPDALWYDTVSGEHGSLGASLQAVYVKFSSKESPSGISSIANCITLSGIGSAAMPFKAGDAVTITGCAANTRNNQTVILREVTYNPDDATWDLFTLDDGIYSEKKTGWTADQDYPVGTTFSWMDGSGSGHLQEYSFETPIPIQAGDIVQLYRDENDAPDYVIIAGSVSVDVTFSEPDPLEPAGGDGTAITFNESDEEDYTEVGPIIIARKVPYFDHVFAHDNRLFGCRGDVIWVSKLGDPFNWNVYDGVATDSWTTETGTAGAFTGGISYAGYARFFKEDRIFTLYGDYPGEYSLQGQEHLGVARGSEKSLVAANGRLFYLSPKGPCAYAGGAPSMIADAFGVDHYENGVAGTDGLKYYISMQDESEAWHLFVYDTQRGIWIREDDLHAIAMTRYGNKAWCMDSEGRMKILGRPGDPPEGADAEDFVEWFVEFGDIMEQSPDRKRINKLQVRLEMEEGAYAEVSLLYDSAQEWTRVSFMNARRTQSVVLPVVPRRVDHFRLKISGRGGCRIGSITRQVAPGSDRR